jgi:hypothetical protein
MSHNWRLIDLYRKWKQYEWCYDECQSLFQEGKLIFSAGIAVPQEALEYGKGLDSRMKAIETGQLDLRNEVASLQSRVADLEKQVASLGQDDPKDVEDEGEGEAEK